MSNIVLGIRLTADGKDLVGAVRVSTDEIDKMTGATKRAGSEARRLNDAQKGLADTSAKLQNALRGVVGAFGLAQLISLTDQYTKFNAQLKLVSISQSEYAQSLSEVRRIATLAQSGLGETAVLYARITNAVRELGIAQRGVSEITETISLALKASGATATESASAMLQLSQAFGSGVLRGEEFNAVNEAAPRLMRALAEGIGEPVGRLREMAEAGKLTSEVMANALPRALNDLRKEAASVQTIAGAFQVLKNNIMEFVGGGAQANGAAQALAGSIGLLAENLALLAGIALTVAASKLAQWATTQAAAMYGSVAASRAAALATLEAARADVVATGSAAALTAARLAELRAVVIAAEGNVALALTTNGLVPAQAAATAASAAHTAALSALTVAQRGASVAATAGSAVLAFLGGPIGAVMIALGLAATAWTVWGRSARDANAQAKDSTVTTSAEILAALAVQNNKLRERIALSKAGNADAAREGGAAAEKLAATLNEINTLKAKGAALTNVDKIMLIELQGRYDEISTALRENKTLTGEIAAIGQQSKAAEWAEDYATKAEKLASTLAKARKELGAAFSPELEKRIREKFAEKSADKNLSAYKTLINSIEEKTALDALEALGVKKLSDAEKLAAKTMVELRDGVLKLNEAQKINLAGKLEGLIAADKQNTQERAAFEARAKAEKQYEDQQTKNEAFLDTLEAKKTDALASAQEGVKQIQFETSLIGLSNDARETAIALRALETSGIDKQSVAYADLRSKITAVLDRRHSAQAIQDQVEAAKRATKQMGDDLNRGLTDSIFRGFEAGKGFVKNFFDSVVNMAKTTVLRPVISFLVSPLSGAIAAGMTSMGLSGAANAASGGFGLFSAGSMAFGGGAQTMADFGNFFGSIGTPMVDSMGALTGATYGLTDAIIGFASANPWTAAAIAAIAVASAVGLFGEDERTASPQMSGLGSTSTINRAGFLGQQWVASGSSPTDLWAGSAWGDLGAEQLAGFNKAIARVFSDAETAARQLGLDTSSLASLTVTMGQTGQGVQRDMAAALQKTADTVALSLMPNLAELQQSGETLAQTFGRLAAAQAALDAQRRTMEISLMEAQGKTLEALAARRADELSAMDASLRPLQEMINKANDLAEAARAAKVEAEAAAQAQAIRLTWMQKWDVMIGATTEKQIEREAQLASVVDEATKVWMKSVFALEDINAHEAQQTDFLNQIDILQGRTTQKAIDRANALAGATDDANRQLMQMVFAMQDQIDASATLAAEQKVAFDEQLRAAQQLQSVYQSINATIQSLFGGNLSPLSPTEKYQQAGASLDMAYAAAMNHDLAASQSIGQIVTQFLYASRGQNASGLAYTEDFNRAIGMLRAVQVPGHASGLDYVPHDNYLMRAHQGEAVLNRFEASGWRSGATGITSADLAAMRQDTRDLRADVQRLTAVVAAGEAANVRATERVAQVQESAAWRDEVKPKLR